MTKVLQVALHAGTQTTVKMSTHQEVTPESSTLEKNYTKALQSNQYPTKDQAIIVDAIEDAQIKDYVTAISNIIDISLIKFISKIANNRICVYLASKQTADNLIDTHKHIVINNQRLPIRPLLSRNKRVILSNVSPHIPHEVIEEYLQKLNVKKTSPISYLRAGIPQLGGSHIMSFRRQVYIPPEDVNKLPESIQINHEDTQYWIYISTDTLSCFLCKKEGHIAKSCPMNLTHNITNSNNNNNNGKIPSNSQQYTNLNTALKTNFPTLRNTNVPDKSSINSPDIELKSPVTKPTGIKRALSKTDSENTNQSEQPKLDAMDYITGNNSQTESETELDSYTSDEATQKQTKKRISKKCRKEHPKDTSIPEQAWEVIEKELELTTKEYPLNFHQLKNFLEMAHGKTDITELTGEYTDKPEEVIEMIREVYPMMPDRKQKYRSSKIIKKLEEIAATKKPHQNPTKT